MRICLGFVFGLELLTLLVVQGLAQATASSSTRHFLFLEPRPAGYLIEKPAAVPGGLKAAGVPEWVEAWPDNGSTNSVEFGSRIVLRLTRATDLPALLAGRPLHLSRTVADRVFIVEASDPWSALVEAESLARDSRVEACHPVSRRPKQLLGRYAPRPNDPFFFQPGQLNSRWQAHLENRDTNGMPLGVDLNVRAAWPVTEGEGIVMAIADDGVELDHPDLVAATQGIAHFNFLTSQPDGQPSGNFSAHATAVAGLAAATSNNRIGIAGVAPKAQLASWVIFGVFDQIASEEGLMDMFQHQSNLVSVQNHSWGKVGAEQFRLTLLEDLAVSNAVTKGRAGRGVVLVRAAGNGREEGNDANDDGYLADPRVISVAAVRLDGRATRYSAPGACVLVAAPSGDRSSTEEDPCFTDSPSMVTTDRQGSRGTNRDTSSAGGGDYAFDSSGFSGTSASTPQIAGLAALILSANTNLTYRDVQQVLIHSSRHYDFADPALITNGAGFRVSHNAGFGVPDAGVAVRLARSWPNRPPAIAVTYTRSDSMPVPDLGLRLRVEGADVPESLRAIAALPGGGPHPDADTPPLSIVDVAAATEPIATDLRAKAALIQRGTNFFCEKIAFAAQAGAELAVVYNNRGGDARIMMAQTDLTPIPSVFISQIEGEDLRDFLAAEPDVRVNFSLESAQYTFEVTNTLQCEFVGLRLDTDHSARGDLRVVLTSPSGTRSVLQRVNPDSLPGPHDWTYYSVQHFYESSFGRWTLNITDQDIKGTGSVKSARLILNGVPIVDQDHDGLDDGWELEQFNTLAYGPADDPDHDGYSNAREQVMGTNPAEAEVPFELDLSFWDSQLARLSWPSDTNTLYRIQIGAESAAPLTLATNVTGQFFETEWFIPYTRLEHQFFKVEAVPHGR